MSVVAESIVEEPRGGAFQAKVYATTVDPVEHVALVKGDVGAHGPVFVRVHAVNTLEDVLSAGGGDSVRKAMDIVEQEGRGVIVLIRESRPDSLRKPQKGRGGDRTGPADGLWNWRADPIGSRRS